MGHNRLGKKYKSPSLGITHFHTPRFYYLLFLLFFIFIMIDLPAHAPSGVSLYEAGHGPHTTSSLELTLQFLWKSHPPLLIVQGSTLNA